MSDRPDEQRVQGEEPAEEPIDFVALTDAVERLLRRELEIERERLRGGPATALRR